MVLAAGRAARAVLPQIPSWSRDSSLAGHSAQSSCSLIPPTPCAQHPPFDQEFTLGINWPLVGSKPAKVIPPNKQLVHDFLKDFALSHFSAQFLKLMLGSISH